MNHKQLKKQLKPIQKLLRKHHKTIIKYGLPLLLMVMAFIAGRTYQSYKSLHTQPQNIVWAIDTTVNIPDDLRAMLMQKNECQSYRGNSAPQGVGLWAVTHLEQGSYAKIAYGCSWSLSDHAVVVKQANHWTVIPPSEYFSDPNQGVPLCTAVVQYKIPVQLEGFCANDTGKLTKNPNPER